MNGRDTFNGSPYLDFCRKNIYSQYGEDGVVDAILYATDAGTRWAFECGAHDGITFSNTRRLLDAGWRVVMAEGDPRRIPSLMLMTTRFAKLQVVPNMIDISELDKLFARLDAPDEPALVCLDIDGQEWHMWNRMLRYFPRVVVIEHSFAPAWADRVPDVGEPAPAQAGPRAIEQLAASKGYDVVAQTLTNSICLRSDLAPGLRAAEAKWYDIHAAAIKGVCPA